MAKKSAYLFPKSSLGVALVFLVLYLFLVMVIKSNLPSSDVLISLIINLYKTYGYPLVFLAGVGEAMFLLGLYFPGSMAILLGAVAARAGVVAFPAIMLLATAGLMTGYTMNYVLGRYGWYTLVARFGLEKTLREVQHKLTRHEGKTLFLGFISPNSAAFVATAAGITGMPFGRFFLRGLSSQLFWGLVWGTIAYTLGVTFVQIIVQYVGYVVWLFAAIWLIKYFRAGKKG